MQAGDGAVETELTALQLDRRANLQGLIAEDDTTDSLAPLSLQDKTGIQVAELLLVGVGGGDDLAVGKDSGQLPLERNHVIHRDGPMGLIADDDGDLALFFSPGKLEDAAVGIGTVARERRKGFLSSWQSAYALIPTGDGALRRAFPQDWQLYRRDPDGYRFVQDFEAKPDAEQMADALDGEGGGVARGLKAVDRLIEGLQN